MKYLLYNPLSGKGNSRQDAEKFSSPFVEDCQIIDVTEIGEYKSFVNKLNHDDELYVFGGDGTLNRFINGLDGEDPSFPVYYYPSGTGNDFSVSVGQGDVIEPFMVNDYIKRLPTVTVCGKKYKFINGVGYGIDGYCCEVGDRLKLKGKCPNYTSIAIKGLLFHYKPTVAKINVDGEEKTFKKVWIAPTMYGSYYGGGMMPTPEQKRDSEERSVSLMVFHGTGKIRTLMIFPSLFKGTHVKHENHVSVFKGKKITVSFDKPTPLQVDGETILGVSEYTVEI